MPIPRLYMVNTAVGRGREGGRGRESQLTTRLLTSEAHTSNPVQGPFSFTKNTISVCEQVQQAVLIHSG